MITIRYQGKLCGPIFEITRNAGLEPDFGYVHMHLSEFLELKVGEAALGIDFVDAREVMRNDPGIQSIGDLVLTQVIDDGTPDEDGKKVKTHEVKWERLLVSERALQSVIAFDDQGDSIFRVDLTDIRYLWDKRGIPVSAWVNVPVQGDPDQAGTDPGVGGGLDNVGALLQTSTLRTAAGAPPPRLIVGSMRDGVPWTLREVLSEIVLPKLPGSPKLTRLPSELEDSVPLGHVWDAVNPKEALAQILDEFQLTLTLDLDSNVSVWKRGEGGLRTKTQNNIAYQSNDPNIDERVAHSKDIVAFKRVPPVVVVIGPPTIATAREKLEPVGEIGGAILPLEEALKAIGLTMDRARKLALAPSGDRAAKFLITAEGLAEFQRWAFRWYRLKGGTKAHANKLPIFQGGRGVVDSIGQFLPHRVRSETHGFVDRTRVKRLDILSSEDYVNGTLPFQKEVLNVLEKLPADYFVAGYNVDFSDQAGKFLIDHERGIVKFHEIQGLLDIEGLPPELSELSVVPAKAEFEFGYQKKPNIDERMTLDHRYHSIWVRTSKAGEPLVIQQVGQNKIPPGSAPLVVRRPDLQQVEDFDSNRAILDTIARGVAEQIFSAPQMVIGSVVTFCRPVPLELTGRVLSVTWSTSGSDAGSEAPHVVAHVGTFAPDAPPEKTNLRTRAFGPQDGALRDSVTAPRGLVR